MENGFGRARRRAQLTQEQSAELLEVSQPTISSWETGEAMPTAAKLPRIAEVYRCTIDDLYMAKKTEGAPGNEAARN